MTLAYFLLARIAEDKAQSRPGPEPTSWCDRGEGAHYEHARIVAECDAKRRIVEELREDYEEGLRDAVVVLRLLALPYAAHPYYRSEWAP